MRQSELFTKTRREAPKGEVSKNAELLVRAGYIHKEMAGVYSFLPLGLRVLNNIAVIIREEMNAIGGQEVFLSGLQNPELWKKTGRWDDSVVDNWFKTKLSDGTELGLGHSHEEPLTALLTEHISSYRDLPKAIYQIQTKFRNELRAKSGLLRGREFMMKDMYSFVRTPEELDSFHERAAEAYKNIFSRAGIGERTFRTFASGGSFSKYSDEFQMLCDAGEDTIYLHRERELAVNREVYTDEVLLDLNLDKHELEEVRAIEVGNIFKLGNRFSEPLELAFTDETGGKKPVLMGCYGLGLSRLMGAVAEALSDEKGLRWPKTLSPFALHLVAIAGEKVKESAEALYGKLSRHGVSVLYDDRDMSAGQKFADADLLGIPYRAIVSQKTLEAGGIELAERAGGVSRMVSEKELFSLS
ncbi:prolyl-tRNA synthetase [Candidatus Kaiserbacteria bacterium RIFCSPHIGHO2_02_FULL_50_9]|uniref:Proline--tRNA ligase n=1 Tax=Candidatus Kaiserbacteria bacterium RIFCSPLOWO2_01_FULL_51_21 TaxID=1798508 RepID=A0A1F6EE07_9BACT|nr:MAG: prolyl-tRNA synthetase [Candidatus Kaiserbacteria bacterium RIFCSPHIGHO2_01_FULL_51_33]OGG63637.1 MAG: prolyl-tRNA synthetase [Candidatus Kaiserbacteria bacterium RIFCSPHIGHO2_02_FULL_50_9]OGG71885.1 MAG: prolyl-tRNA synthetase [Candidatus Kaiserbacteria bacterium RIFCSPLOWO2_01_FULL_51_21]